MYVVLLLYEGKLVQVDCIVIICAKKTYALSVMNVIITVNKGDSVFSLSRQYGILSEKIMSDNGLEQDDSLVTGQSLVIVKPSQVFDAVRSTDVSYVSAETGVSEKTLYRNNFFLGGRQEVPSLSQVVLKYEDEPSEEIILGGYAYDFISNDRLYEVINYLTYIMPFTYGFTPDGSLVVAEDEYIINAARKRGIKPLMHLSTLTEEGNFDSNLPVQLFENTDSISNLINNVVMAVLEKGYDGVDVDFEFLPLSQRENYVEFLAILSERLDEIDKILVVAVPPKTSREQRGILYEGIEYEGIGRYADYVLIMTYEWGYKYGPPLAIAPIPSVRRVLDYAVTEIPRGKILLGISNYGYDWTLPFVAGVTEAETISNIQAVDIARRYGAEIGFDSYSKAPYFFYTDDEEKQHEVWFEDARSFEEKIKLIEEYSLAGGFIWELMRSNPQGYVTLNSLVKIK